MADVFSVFCYAFSLASTGVSCIWIDAAVVLSLGGCFEEIKKKQCAEVKEARLTHLEGRRVMK